MLPHLWITSRANMRVNSYNIDVIFGHDILKYNEPVGNVKFYSYTLTASKCSCHTPNEEAGPPTFVLAVPPLPRPGLTLIPHFLPGNNFPKRSNCSKEHALNSMPIAYNSAKLSGNSCDERHILCGGTPARIARRTS